MGFKKGHKNSYIQQPDYPVIALELEDGNTVPGKECNSCHGIKPLNKFWKEVTGKHKARCAACQKLKNKEYQTKDYNKNLELKRNYGITLEDYKRIYNEQEGKCQICFREFERLSVDHCHKTGKVRALLCDNCNQGIGRLDENIQFLENAINYIRKYNE